MRLNEIPETSHVWDGIRFAESKKMRENEVNKGGNSPRLMKEFTAPANTCVCANLELSYLIVLEEIIQGHFVPFRQFFSARKDRTDRTFIYTRVVAQVFVL